jgi:Flp pilus assembly protein TadG
VTHRSTQAGQSTVEWAISAFVLLLFAFSLLAAGHVVGEYMSVRSAASQAAFAAARAPSAGAAEAAGRRAALQAVSGSQVRDFQVTVSTGAFERGGTLTVRTAGCVSLGDFPIASQVLGQCVPLRWTARALIEPYRSRTPAS